MLTRLLKRIRSNKALIPRDVPGYAGNPILSEDLQKVEDKLNDSIKRLEIKVDSRTNVWIGATILCPILATTILAVLAFIYKHELVDIQACLYDIQRHSIDKPRSQEEKKPISRQKQEKPIENKKIN